MQKWLSWFVVILKETLISVFKPLHEKVMPSYVSNLLHLSDQLLEGFQKCKHFCVWSIIVSLKGNFLCTGIHKLFATQMYYLSKMPLSVTVH